VAGRPAAAPSRTVRRNEAGELAMIDIVDGGNLVSEMLPRAAFSAPQTCGTYGSDNQSGLALKDDPGFELKRF